MNKYLLIKDGKVKGRIIGFDGYQSMVNAVAEIIRNEEMEMSDIEGSEVFLQCGGDFVEDVRDLVEPEEEFDFCDDEEYCCDGCRHQDIEKKYANILKEITEAFGGK